MRLAEIFKSKPSPLGLTRRRGEMARHMNRGVTLTEMIIVSVIIVIAISLTKVGIDLANNFFREFSTVTAKQQMQSTVYNLVREVRNCNTFVNISSDTLSFTVFNSSNGYDTDQNPHLFDAVNLGTVTYQFTEGPGRTYLRRRLWENDALRTDQTLLVNVLVEPDLAHPMFEPEPNDGTPLKNIFTVVAHFKIRIGSSKYAPFAYDAQIMRRTFNE